MAEFQAESRSCGCLCVFFFLVAFLTNTGEAAAGAGDKSGWECGGGGGRRGDGVRPGDDRTRSG